MFKFSFSVRAYYVARYYGFPHFEDWSGYPARILATHAAIAGRLALHAHKGKKTVVELLRASGLGVYRIADTVSLPIGRVRELCNHFDMTLHEGL